jgi:hypothetical protein
MNKLEPITYIDHSEVREGKLENLKTAISELVKLVEANEPRLIAYNAYLTGGGKRMTVVHVHHDSASLKFHMKVAGPAFPKFAQFIKLTAIDIYGELDDDLLKQLQDEARMLGSGTVTVHKLHAGFFRLGVR